MKPQFNRSQELTAGTATADRRGSECREEVSGATITLFDRSGTRIVPLIDTSNRGFAFWLPNVTQTTLAVGEEREFNVIGQHITGEIRHITPQDDGYCVGVLCKTWDHQSLE